MPRVLQTGLESVDAALLVFAVWWHKTGRELVEKDAKRLTLAANRAKKAILTPGSVFWGRGVEARGQAPARFVQNLWRKR